MKFHAILIAACLCSQIAFAREWKDNSGKMSQEADLVDFDLHLVILKKADGSLVAVGHLPAPVAPTASSPARSAPARSPTSLRTSSPSAVRKASMVASISTAR